MSLGLPSSSLTSTFHILKLSRFITNHTCISTLTPLLRFLTMFRRRSARAPPLRFGKRDPEVAGWPAPPDQVGITGRAAFTARCSGPHCPP